MNTHYIYHAYATYQSRGGNTIHQYDGIIVSNGMIILQEHLDVTRSEVASGMAEMLGYTPVSSKIVIQSLSFLHTVDNYDVTESANS